MKKLLLAALVATAGIASAQLYTQPYDGTSFGFISQTVTDHKELSTYLFDDLNIGTPWTINKITAFGEEGGIASATTAVTVRIQENHSFTNPGAIALEVRIKGNSAMQSGNAVLDIPDIVVDPGQYWISVWVDRPFDTGGQWNWRSTQPVTGSEAWAHNPGGGLLGSTDPGTIDSFSGLGPTDLAFEIDGTAVPEPATFVAIGLGLAALLARKRK
ncbi:MAG TPA: PEP-CTERM sorting domain-containing protein [Fimbriimonadales bacterium]|jgi:hypothetical protein|nr:PEP-CTERM sorting domain-containing protein [Fimbriimonadales bacterium]